MKANPENLQYVILGNTGLHILKIGDITTKSVSSVTLFGITTDSNFKEHINNFINKHAIIYTP